MDNNMSQLVKIINNDKTPIISIDSCIKLIEKLDESSSVKWKHVPNANQVVIQTNKYYYKLYMFKDIDSFNSIIRHKLAEIYNEYGIHWEIQTFELQNGMYLDIEQREKLNVCTTWSDEILVNYSSTLRKLEEKLNFNSLFKQLVSSFPDLAYVKLIRQCVNKSIDYATFNDKIILLDDADWFISLIDDQHNTITRVVYPIKILLDENEFIFYSQTLKRTKHLTTEMLCEPIDKFFLFKSNAQEIIENFNNLKQELHHMIDTNIRLFINEDNKYLSSNKLDSEKNKLYTNNTGRKSFQWELWHYCNSLCKFCYLGKENRIHIKERQMQSLRDLYLILDRLDYTKYNNISLIGGEFFQGQLDDQEIHDMFFKVIEKIFNLYLGQKIGSIWITCTLTIGDQKHLYELLDLAKIMGVEPVQDYNASGLWLCTSWDAKGRFHNKQMEDNWKYHMLNIQNKYPFVKFNTTIILQQAFIEKYLNGEFKPKDFMNKFKTTLFYKQCGVVNPNMDDSQTDKEFDQNWIKSKQEFNENVGFEFFPKRESFLKFLIKYYQEDFDTFDRLYNIKFRADELHRNFNDIDHDVSMERKKDTTGVEDTTVRKNKCGHLYYYAHYNDSNDCCICDKQNIII